MRSNPRKKLSLIQCSKLVIVMMPSLNSEYSSNNIHLSLALQKFETSLAAKLRSLSRKKEPSHSQRFISSRLLIDHFVFLLIGISHQSIKGTNNAYGHEDQSILFFSSKGDGENNSWQEAPCSLHKKRGDRYNL